MKFKREVVGSNVVHRGDTVTYKSRIWIDSGVERYLPKVRDVPPAGFTLVPGSAKLTYLNATNKVTFSNESDGGVSAKCSGSGCNAFGNGYIVKSGQDVTLEVSYKVPETYAFSTVDSGLLFDVWSFTGNPKGSNPFNVKVRVEEIGTTTTLQAPSAATTGDAVTLTATVNPGDATGQVQFKDGGTDIGSPVTPVNGVATLSHAFASSGTRNLTAEFIPGTGYFGSTSAPHSISVADPVVTTALAVSAPATAVSGTEVALTADVTPSNAAGTVQFSDNGTAIGSPVTVSNGTAVLPHTFTVSGAHDITAEFVGATGFTNATASAQTVDVSDPDQQTSVSVQVPADATTGDAVTLTANVTPQNAHGTVQFKVDGTAVGSPVTVVDGVATAPHTFDAAGEFAVTADFAGATGFTSSTAAAQNVTVTDPDVETSLSLTVPASATTGESTDLSAAVTPSSAQGTVQFSVGGVSVGSPVPVVNGSAVLPHTFDTAGEFAVSAVYSGATGFTGSTAQSQTVTVTDPAPVDVETSTLVGVPAAATTGVDTTLSVTVQPKTGTEVPSGSVQFRDNGNPIGNPVTLDNGSGSLIHVFTATGTHQITADYTPDAGFVGSTSTQRPVVVSAPNLADVESSVVITSTQSAVAGTAFTVKAQVIGADTLPGTVQFFDGAVEIGQPVAVVNGTAELVHTFTTSGPHQIHAVYSGGAGVTGSTSPVQIIDVAASGDGGGDGGETGTGSLGSLSGLRFGS
ncbi:Ig-like domain-containing protein [Prescottella sp. R16]|uniref:Ig-like domain-containing protein n=1 Tax=Prescottella sp. R16 TaxID=3064529 RepID=UPI00272EB12C|nr:Ig-like domain-containing protein [Prescottella sp. R16]